MSRSGRTHPLPDSADPLKVKAVEFFNAAVDAHIEGQIGQARGHLLDAAKLDPDNALAHYGLGVVLNDKVERDAAIEHYSVALRIDPVHPQSQYNLGCALAAKKVASQAVAALRKAIELLPLCRDKAKGDADYDPIRDDRAFRKLVYGEQPTTAPSPECRPGAPGLIPGRAALKHRPPGT